MHFQKKNQNHFNKSRCPEKAQKCVSQQNVTPTCVCISCCCFATAFSQGRTFLYKGQPFGPRFRRGPSWVGNLKGRNYMHFTQSLPWFSLFQSFPYFLSFLTDNLRILESICSQKFNFHVFDFSNHIWTRQHALKQSSLLFFAFFVFLLRLEGLCCTHPPIDWDGPKVRGVRFIVFF